MTILVIDTALAAHSIALLDGAAVLAWHHEIIERGHAEALMPALAALMQRAGVERPDAVLVDTGPGSFTGLRIGIAAARALGLAWGVPVTGYRSLALIAAPLFAADPGLERLSVVAEAGRGQLFLQVLDRNLADVAEPLALDAAAVAARLDPTLPLAGPGAARVAALGNFRVVGEAWPDARDAALLPPAARALSPDPLYVRPPDAVPTAVAA
ncbi:tRNA (adenosine(37)-N6)-threonylcarbamoyltransferase complex dimerization subunit type 1 TsaB [Sphingosinicellaceae bacterium]|nr:tRNA (adenosine(37)-N6)-threonylcarbamoyltransferase complex dimerization subunit type 1 TsaB [Sphingosinicellaceae bacterium]